jgi:hypothetical protein
MVLQVATATFLVRARRRAQLRYLGLSRQSCALACRLRHCSLQTGVTAGLLTSVCLWAVATTVLVGGTVGVTSDGISQQQQKKRRKCLHRACDLDHV